MLSPTSYETIVTLLMNNKLKKRPMDEILGKLVAFENYKEGMVDAQPSKLAIQVDEDQSNKCNKRD